MKLRRNKTPKEYIQPGEMLGDVRYRVDGLWEDNDITVTYYGYDTFRQKEVVIRELFPQAIMERDYDKGYDLVCKKLSDEAVFEAMREHMIARAKKLIKLYPIEGIANVLTYFEEHRTVYVIEEKVEGQTLKDFFFRRHSAKFTVEDVMRQMGPVMDILTRLHAKGIVHGCLSPENILITPEKKIVLLQCMNPIDDLAHDCLGSPKIRRDGFSPVELYIPEANRGPKTDLYEVAAILYYYVTGQEIPAYYQRINKAETIKDPVAMQTIIMDFQGDALLKALSIYDFDRYESLDEFRKQLFPDDMDFSTLHSSQETIRIQKKMPWQYTTRERSRKRYLFAVAALIAIFVIVMVPRMFHVGKDEGINRFYKRFINASEDEQCKILLDMSKLERQTYTNDYLDMDQTKDDEDLAKKFQAKYYDFQLKRYVTADRVDTKRSLYEYLKIDYRRDHIYVTYLSNDGNWVNDISRAPNQDGSFSVNRTTTDAKGKEKTEKLTVKP